mgnify:CR=1 FL=1
MNGHPSLTRKRKQLHHHARLCNGSFGRLLVLSAQYESWTSPIAAIMGLPIALLGAILGCFVMGVPVSIYTQIGIILLIALSAKNGILIVEFARDYHKAGNPIRESALEAGHIRLRPILILIRYSS